MSEITVSVVGSTTINPTVGNGDTVNVAIASTGERGPSGSTGPAGPANTLTIGTVTQGTAAATITGTSPSQVLNLVLQKGDAGTPATNIELQATGTHIQWRLVGASTWTNLVALSAITGPTGSTGAAGTAVELQASSTHIQWRYVGGLTWTNVVALSSLVGATGATGATGPQGPPINLADETPQPLGTASAGTALSAARADHVHAQGSIAYSALTGIPSTFAPSAHTHAVSDVTGLQAALDGKQASGTYATLVSGTVPSSQLPSYVDDVVEYANLAAFTEQAAGKIYVARDTGKVYRWSGSAYIEISPSPGSTDSVTEGSSNLYFTHARAAAAAPVQSVAGRAGTISLTKSDVGLGGVDNTSDSAKPVSTAQATADAAVQAFAIQRANHTGTQTAATISDFSTQVAKYAPVTSVNGLTGDVTVSGGGGSGLTWSSVPASATATGTAGQIAYDGTSGFFYVASATNSWRRFRPDAWDVYRSSTSLLLPFNGTMTDCSPTPKTVTVNGNASALGAARFGSYALSLGAAYTGSSTGSSFENTTGTGDWLDISDSSAFNFGSGDFTVELWYYPIQRGNYSKVVGPTGASGDYPFAIYHGLVVNSGNPIAAFGPSTSAWFTNASSISFGAVTDNVWVHLAVVRQGDTFRTYKNGVQQATGTTDSAGQSLGSISTLRIGRSGDFYNKCLIDDFRVTKGVCRYPSGTTFTPPTTGLPID
jgi:hypothetical protein